MKEDMQMANKLMKIFSTLLANYCLLQWLKKKGKLPILSSGEDEKQPEIQTFFGGNAKMIQRLRKRAWKSFKKLHIHLPYSPVLPHLSIFPNEMKTLHMNIDGHFTHNHSNTWKSSNVFHLVNELTKRDTSIRYNTSQK